MIVNCTIIITIVSRYDYDAPHGTGTEPCACAQMQIKHLCAFRLCHTLQLVMIQAHIYGNGRGNGSSLVPCITD